eukprot:m.378918 g.378918  ORF g.378918 m.378918 type:complete len:218 (+) comp20941_c1_seq3:182-835(+)
MALFRSSMRLAQSASSVRALSTSAASLDGGLVRPELQLFGVEGRYAHGLFSAASKKDVLGKVEKELGTVKGMMADDEVFRSFLETPVLSRADKTASIDKIMQHKKFSEITTNFFKTMAENNRLSSTGPIITAFETLMQSSRNQTACVITSAEALDGKTQTALKKSLSGFAPGKEIIFSTKVDASILGGLVVEIGDKYIDMSTKTKVKKIVKELNQPI